MNNYQNFNGNQNPNQNFNQGFQNQNFQNQYPMQQEQQGFQPQGQQFQQGQPQQFQQQGQPQQFQQQAQPVYNNNIIEGSFTIETAGVDFGSGGNGGNPNRNPNLQDVPEGLQFARLYKLVDIGTHAGYKGETNRILKFFFEFPTYQQQFNLDSPQLKPSVISAEINFFTGDKSKLRKLCNACIGRTLSDEEMKHFDFISLLGSVVCVTVVRKQSKTNGKYYTNLGEFSAVGAMPIPPEFNNPALYRNPLTAFYLGPNAINLSKENFANLPLGDRRKIMQSAEAQAYVMAGNRVFRNDNNAKDNFYNDGSDPQNNQNNGFNQQQNPNAGFTQPNVNPQQFQQQGYQQPQGNAQFAPQGGGFPQGAQGQPSPQAQQFNGQQYNNGNVQANGQGGAFAQGGQQQGNFNPGVQNQAQSVQGQQATHPFQNGNQQGFAQPQVQQGFNPNQVSPQMNQAVQQVQQQFGGQPSAAQPIEQAPAQDGGFGAFLNQQTGGNDDLPF